MTNVSNDEIKIIESNDTLFFQNDTIKTLSTDETFKKLRLIENGFWFYALPFQLVIWFNNVEGTDISLEFAHPISILLGLMTATANWSKARNCNKDFKNDLEAFNLNNKKIKVNETKEGFIYLKGKHKNSFNISFYYSTNGKKKNIVLTDIKF